MIKQFKALLEAKAENEEAIASAKAEIVDESNRFYDLYLSQRFDKFPEGRGANMYITYVTNPAYDWGVNDCINNNGYCIYFESVTTGLQYPVEELSVRPELGEGYLGDSEDSNTGAFDFADLLDSLEVIVREGFTTPEESVPQLLKDFDDSVDNLKDLAEKTKPAETIEPFGNPDDFGDLAQTLYNHTAIILEEDGFKVSDALKGEIDFDFGKAVVCIADRSGAIPPIGSHVSVLVSRLTTPDDDFVVYLYDGKYSLPTQAIELASYDGIHPDLVAIQKIRNINLLKILEDSAVDHVLSLEEQAHSLDKEMQDLKNLFGEDVFKDFLSGE